MPVARSPADILCLALYTLAGGRILRGFMVQTVADRLGAKALRQRVAEGATSSRFRGYASAIHRKRRKNCAN